MSAPHLSLHEMTEYQQAMEELRASEARYHALFNGITEGFALHEIVCAEDDTPSDYRFLDISPSFEHLTGLSRAEVVGRLQSEVLPQEDPKWVEMYGRVALTGVPCRFENYSPVLERHFEVYAYRPAPQQFAVLFVDVTERMRAIEERDILQAQLAQAQKMESMGRLAGGVAHDFNNMLEVILGYTQLAMTETSASQPLLTFLTEIQTAAERSADLTRHLLAFARKQAVSPSVLDLNATIAGMLKMLRRLIGEDITLVWLPGKAIWPIMIDRSQVDQLLANLAVNARDAITSVGEITIETANIVCDQAYCAIHAGMVTGDYVLLTVSDNGCGMAAETQAHLFEPFFTTKAVGEGTGLGLSTVYGVVSQNRGFVHVYSEPGCGSTFKIYFPRHVDATHQPTNVNCAQADQRGRETVLLVEDEPSILRLGQRILEPLGYQVLTAASPGDAITTADTYAGEIHLLLTDVIMPEMNGRELFSRLLPRHPHLKCLFMSGYTANVIANHGVLDEGVNFLQKPFTIHELTSKVREVLLL